MTEALFELEDDQDDPDAWATPRDDDTAPTCCRYCQTATTAAGIENRGHGPDSATCARYLAWEDRE